jgi:Zn-finger nucleic acid-binding protein
MADCPKCPYVGLNEVAVSGVTVDECPECGGRWYDAGELEAVAKSPEKLRASVENTIDERASERPCARCGGGMKNRGLINRMLRVDFCPACRGFWVDKNELHLIDRLLD